MIVDYPTYYDQFIMQDEINIDIIDPCLTTVLQPPEEAINLYAIIGIGNQVHQFKDYNDTKSLAIDHEDDYDYGYKACRAREHQLIYTLKDSTE